MYYNADVNTKRYLYQHNVKGIGATLQEIKTVISKNSNINVYRKCCYLIGIDNVPCGNKTKFRLVKEEFGDSMSIRDYDIYCPEHRKHRVDI